MLGTWTVASTLHTVAVVFVVAAVVQVIRWLLAYRSHFLFINSLPGETDFSWIWGNLHKIRNENTDSTLRYFRELTRKYPKFWRMWNGPFRASIMLHHPDTLKTLLKTAGPKPWNYDFAIPWLGEGLLIARGARWQRSRRLITPAFHFSILKPYNTVSNRASDHLVQKVEKHAMEKTSMEMFSLISLCTFDVILQCAMSYSDDIQLKGESHFYVKAIYGLTDLLDERNKNPLVYWDWVYNLTKNGKRNRELCDTVHSLAEGIVNKRKESLDREGPPKKRFLDFLDILLTAKDENGVGLTPTEIRSEVDTFMFEGHDTTASAICWTLFSLCEHQDYQRKVQEEIDEVLQDRECDDIEWEDLSKLEYLQQTIKEGMRLHNPVPFPSRLLTEPLNVDGVTLPVGSRCVFAIYNLHHNPTVWPKPDVYDPDRFHPDNLKGRDSYAFIPFSAGPRNCIGQHFAMNEMKVMLARLLRRFTFSLDSSHKIERKWAAIMRTEHGIKMFAVPRTSSL